MRIRAGASFCALGAALLFSLGASFPPEAKAAPNIVVVMSDDQPYQSVEEMPFVSSLEGLEPFGTLYDNVAMCCPARATFLTGLYSQHTGVELNRDAVSFDPRETLATWLDERGYETALFGKYLNQYPFGGGTGRVPPGWDRWAAFIGKGARYYDYALNVDGRARKFGDDPHEYSTDVLAKRARRFVKAAPEPFFALVTPFGPHGRAIPAPRHEHLYDDAPFVVRPNFNTVAEGAPPYYQDFPESDRRDARVKWRDRMEALRSVDELSERVITAADERPGETVFLYLSDNGFSLGSHRWPGKRCGYEECGRVPGLIRADGDASGLLASIADLAPTLADLANAPTAPTDGESLVPQFNGAPEDPARAVLLRNRASPGGGEFGHGLPSFWGLRTQRWKYLRHGLGAANNEGTDRPEELYDLSSDPFELHNLADDPSHATTLQQLRARLEIERAAPPQN